MRVLIFGATGMIGQGVLRECLADDAVTQVITIGRGTTGQQHPKLRELVHADMFDYSGSAGDSIAAQLTGVDACFYCLGVTSSGMTEADYRRTTYDLTLAAAQALLERSPNATFIFVSGAGADSSERGRVMWARVKGKTENAVLRLPFRATYVFRPGVVQPLHGIRSRTRAYRIGYAVLAPLFPVLRRLFPRLVTTTERVGRAMLHVARDGNAKRLLENGDIDAAGRPALAA